MCGLVHATCVMTPSSLTFFFASYSVSNPWCADSGAVKSTPSTAAMIPNLDFIDLSPRAEHARPLLLLTRSHALDARRGTVLVVLQADELEEILAVLDPRANEAGGEVQRHAPRERPWIVDRELVRHAPEIDARPALDRVQLLGVRCAAAVEPELVVVADGVDDERVFFEAADRVAPPGRNRIDRVRAPIHVDDAMRPGIARLMQLVDVRQPLRRVGHRELPRVRVDARDAHGQAGRVGLVLGQPLVPELARPGEQRQFARFQAALALDVAVRSAAEPRPRDVDGAVGQAGDRLAADVLVGYDRVRGCDVPHLLLCRNDEPDTRDRHEEKSQSFHVDLL